MPPPPLAVSVSSTDCPRCGRTRAPDAPRCPGCGAIAAGASRLTVAATGCAWLYLAAALALVVVVAARSCAR